jgi:tRNA (cytidine32/uridine32-2'-O)-methyltransferase
MKTMGLNDLRLVQPKHFPSADATVRASGADDVLHGAEVCETLSQAIAGCSLAIATSARARELGVPEVAPREAAQMAAEASPRGPVAFVFGRERWGLSNDELDECQAMLRVPTDPTFSSLNLASAVQLVCYELRLVALRDKPVQTITDEASQLVGVDELEGLYEHFENALATIGYYDPQNPKRLMRRIRRLFSRTGLEDSELKILRGILTAAQRSARRDS